MTKLNTRGIRICANNYWDRVNLQQGKSEDVPIEIITIEDADPEKFIFYIYGGGFVHGEVAWGIFML